ncbi:MAG: DNA (cytosine-5-)-methyltransferase [Bacteroidetes bacterium]|nr:DNA (cytosine-5-)-methyltransferase [Bacteroidota bacterium]
MARSPKRDTTPALRVVELFAGVGGFRIGLERAGGFQVVWSNQWEPGKRKQLASDIYAARFGAEHHVCADIAGVPTADIPDHDLLVGGFPCQDYSVASTLKTSKGLVGKKGVLWWQIHRILSEKRNKPGYLLLENVDRLLGSPAGQRGRDFAVMLSSLNALGYAVEWRVVNAADYGMPQRRKRIFLFGWRGPRKALSPKAAEALLTADGLFASVFPLQPVMAAPERFVLADDLARLSKGFNKRGTVSPFHNAGVMVGGTVYTQRVRAHFDGPLTTLGQVLQEEAQVPKAFFIPKGQLRQWAYLKGAKKESRAAANGHHYHYAEGAMAFPDALDKAARTIITGEGGISPSRFKHVVGTPSGRLRRLTPVELERLNMFPDDHTAGVPDTWRAFFMGNALVTGVVERIGRGICIRHRRPEGT